MQPAGGLGFFMGHGAIGVTGLICMLLVGTFPVAAQDNSVEDACVSTWAGERDETEPPPFPVLYGGTVYRDGQIAPEDACLRVRVGDWNNAVEVDSLGMYSILVAPPSSDYYLHPVTFHIGDLQAEETDVFLPAGGPTFKDRGYDLHFTSQEAVESTPSPSLEETPSPAVDTPTPTASPVSQPATVTPAPETTETPNAANGSDGSRNGPTGLVVLALAALGGSAALAGGGYAFLRARRGR